MQFLRTITLSIINFCIPLVRKSRDEPDAESRDLRQEILRLEVENAIWMANLKMDEHERLRESMEEFAKEWRRGFPERD